MILFIIFLNISFIEDKRVPILLKSVKHEIIQINLRHIYQKEMAKVNYTIIVMINDFKSPLNYIIFFINKKILNVII